MKKALLLGVLLAQVTLGWTQSVSINATGALPNAKAMLDIASTTSGLLIPRMTTAQRDAIPSPPVGLQVFNLTTNTLDLFKAGQWEAVTLTAPTTTVKQQRFTASGTNRFTYTGKEGITGKALIIIGAKAINAGCDFSIALAKSGVVIPNPNGSMAAASNNQSFQITLATEVDLVPGNYLEAFIRTNNSSTSVLAVEELQFRVTD